MSADSQIQDDEEIAHEERFETVDFAFTLLPLVDAILTRLQCELSRFFFRGQIGSVRVGGEHVKLQMLEDRSRFLFKARRMDFLLSVRQLDRRANKNTSLHPNKPAGRTERNS